MHHEPPQFYKILWEQRRRLLHRACRQLPLTQSLSIKLYLDGLSHSQIAKVLGVSRQAIRQAQVVAVERLRRMLT